MLYLGICSDNLLTVKRVDFGCISLVFTKRFEKVVGKLLWTHLCINLATSNLYKSTTLRILRSL